MKRLLVRSAALTGVVVVGITAFALSQRGDKGDKDATTPPGEPVAESSADAGGSNPDAVLAQHSSNEGDPAKLQPVETDDSPVAELIAPAAGRSAPRTFVPEQSARRSLPADDDYGDEDSAADAMLIDDEPPGELAQADDEAELDQSDFDDEAEALVADDQQPIAEAREERAVAVDRRRAGDRYGRTREPAPLDEEEPAETLQESDEEAAIAADDAQPAPGDERDQLQPNDDALAEDRPEEPGQFATDSQSAQGGGIQGAGQPGDKRLEGPQAPALVIEKIPPGDVQVGKPAIFEIRVRNAGTVAAQGVWIRDSVPRGAELIGTTPAATSSEEGALVWELGSLAPGASATVQMELLPLEEGEIGSVASVQFASEASGRCLVTRPELKLSVETSAQVMIGEELRVVIRLTNMGSGPATGVVLTETVPDILEHPAGAELEYEIGTLQLQETKELELSLKAARAGQGANLLTARGDGRASARQESPVEVVAPGLQVGLTGPKRRFLERQAKYTLSVTNPGTAAARDIELITYLPKGLKFVQADNEGEYDAQTRSVHWSLEELSPQDSGEVTLVTLPVEAGEQLLRVEGTAARGLSDVKEEAILVEGVAAILFQVADLSDPIEVGGETTYEIRVINQGSKEAANVEVTAILPSELECVAAEGPTRHDVQGQQVVFSPLARLAPKAETVYRLKVQGNRPGDMRVRVQLTTDEMRSPVTKEESTHVYADDQSE